MYEYADDELAHFLWALIFWRERKCGEFDMAVASELIEELRMELRARGVSEEETVGMFKKREGGC